MCAICIIHRSKNPKTQKPQKHTKTHGSGFLEQKPGVLPSLRITANKLQRSDINTGSPLCCVNLTKNSQYVMIFTLDSLEIGLEPKIRISRQEKVFIC